MPKRNVFEKNPVIGLKRGSVSVSAYSAQWPELYEQEKNCIAAAIGPHILDIRHVGSTSIPGMPAKPVIDIAVSVEHFESAYVCTAPVQKLGYVYKGEHGIDRRHYFVKQTGGLRTVHVHMNEINSKAWYDLILFRDYLLASPGAAHEYAALKKRLAKKCANDADAYQKGKAEFIQSILKQAYARARVALS